MLNYQKIKRWILAILAIAAVLAWLAVFGSIPSRFLKVVFFDVGQGDAIFIETPNRRQILIDAGPDNSVLEKLGEEMPFFDREIDLVILTHPDSDHLIGLLAVAENFRLNYVLTNGSNSESLFYQKWLELLKEKNVPIEAAKAGQLIDLGGGAILKVLWPDYSQIDNFSSNDNNLSVVVQLVYQQAEVLLTGDIESKAENYLIRQGGLESDVLKVAHHGSKNSSSDNFIRLVNSSYSAISVGLNNRFGHPHNSVLERLKNTTIFRTDLNGDVEMRTNGYNWQIKTDR